MTEVSYSRNRLASGLQPVCAVPFRGGASRSQSPRSSLFPAAITHSRMRGISWHSQSGRKALRCDPTEFLTSVRARAGVGEVREHGSGLSVKLKEGIVARPYQMEYNCTSDSASELSL